jgi:hypothetical protein
MTFLLLTISQKACAHLSIARVEEKDCATKRVASGHMPMCPTQLKRECTQSSAFLLKDK